MSEEMYWIEGDVQIPEEQRDLVNHTVLRVLQICGVRKREKMILSGKEVEVAALPRPDGEGLVKFDYSVFENEKRDLCVYDTASCHLQAHDFGTGEFSLPIGLIMALEALFSNGSCQFMSDHGKEDPYSWLRVIMRLLPDEKSYSLLTEKAAHGLQWIFERNNEDEFLEYWGNGRLNLSSCLAWDYFRWICDYDRCREVGPGEVERVLSEILSDMVQIWHCRLGDRAFAEEFLSHREYLT